MLLIGIVAAQQPVQLVDGLSVVLAVGVAIGGADFLAGMDVVEIESARGLLFCGKIGQRLSGVEKSKGCKQ